MSERKRWRRREGEGKKREKTQTWRGGHCVSEEMGMNLHLTGGTNYGCL